MSLFGSHDLVEPEISDQKIAAVLEEIRQNARNRRLALIAPVALAAAVLAAFIASPQRYGGLALVPEAAASDPVLPRVFGANGVWRLAETIAESGTASEPGPASLVEAPAELPPPLYSLVPPSSEELHSLPVSTSTPPTSTPGQSPDPELVDGEVADGADVDADVGPGYLPIVLEDAVFTVPIAADTDQASSEPSGTLDDGRDDTSSVPAPSASVEETTTPPLSSTDEDVVVAETQPQEPTDDAVEATTADIGDLDEANPSTPQDDPAVEEAQPANAVATIVPLSVLVHSAHVSVTVLVVDDDSSVIDWCNTRVDWGDGSVTRGTTDEAANCAAPCEQPADSSVGSLSNEVVFDHDYQMAIDAAPRIFVATGDGCNYTLAEYQLNRFTVVPY